MQINEDVFVLEERCDSHSNICRGIGFKLRFRSYEPRATFPPSLACFWQSTAGAASSEAKFDKKRRDLDGIGQTNGSSDTDATLRESSELWSEIHTWMHFVRSFSIRSLARFKSVGSSLGVKELKSFPSDREAASCLCAHVTNKVCSYKISQSENWFSLVWCTKHLSSMHISESPLWELKLIVFKKGCGWVIFFFSDTNLLYTLKILTKGKKKNHRQKFWEI